MNFNKYAPEIAQQHEFMFSKKNSLNLEAVRFGFERNLLNVVLRSYMYNDTNYTYKHV